MNSFPMIKKLGLNIWDYKDPHHHFAVDAEELERLLQSAQVVYGPDNRYWNDVKELGDDYTAVILGITPLKKKTKAEAALELLEKLARDHDKLIQPEWHVKEAKRILEMKD